MTEYEGRMKKYEGKYEEIWRKYEGIYGKHEGNMTKYRPQDLKKFRAFLQKGGGNADTIPGMAPSTEREGGSPAKIQYIWLIRQSY